MRPRSGTCTASTPAGSMPCACASRATPRPPRSEPRTRSCARGSGSARSGGGVPSARGCTAWRGTGCWWGRAGAGGGRGGGGRRGAGRAVRRRPAWMRWTALAAAAVVVLVVGWRALGGRGAGWVVARVDGAPSIDGTALAGTGTLRVGDVIVTDDSSRVEVQVGRIGRVEVLPGSELRLVAARPDAHRLALTRGTIYAEVTAPPRLFVVETPSATAIDLGCAYTLEVDATGASRLRVTAGYVELEGGGRRSIVPLGALAGTRSGQGPGTPYVEDAPAVLREALSAFDFERGGARA